MKLSPQISSKITTKLFCNKYKYKVVLVTAAAGWFRGKDFSHVAKQLKNNKSPYYKEMTVNDKQYARALLDVLSTLSNYSLRAESPFLSIYTNNKDDLELIANISPTCTKYVSMPDPDTEHLLNYNTIITKRIDHEYKVTLGQCFKDNLNFIHWCENNPKIRMTKRTINDLSKPHSHGGGYFYVKDDKTLTIVKIFLGSYISKIDRIVIN